MPRVGATRRSTNAAANGTKRSESNPPARRRRAGRGDEERVDAEPFPTGDEDALVAAELPVAQRRQRDQHQVEPRTLSEPGKWHAAAIACDRDATRPQRRERQSGDADEPGPGGKRPGGSAHRRLEAKADSSERSDVVKRT